MELLKSNLTLERSLLTPVQVLELRERTNAELSDYHRWMVDWNLLDAFKEVYGAFPSQQMMVDEVRKSAKDKKCTKCFRNVGATLENLDHFLDPKVERKNRAWLRDFRVAKQMVTEAVKVQRLTPIVLTKDINTKLIWSSGSASAGAIGYGSKDENAQACIEAALRIKECIANGTPFKDIWIPAMVFHRAQIGDLIIEGTNKYSEHPKEKDRLVVGVDGATVSVEAQYARPLINHLSKFWTGYAGGKDPEKLRRLIMKANHDMPLWYSLDYSKFDQTIQYWLINEAFDIIKLFFDAQYHLELDWIKYNFIHTKLIVPGRGLVEKHRGIPSGSYFTQSVGSICNALVMLTYLSSLSGADKTEDLKTRYVKEMLTPPGNNQELTMFVMGDDNLIFTNHRLDLEHFSKYVSHIFGMTIHPDKGSQGTFETYPDFLKREWRGILGEYRNPADLFINVTHPENKRTYDNYSPWHIMYGLFLTYRAAFPRCITEMYFIEKMQANGGIQCLLSLNPRDLPGSLRAQSHESRKWMYNRAKAALVA